VARPYGLGRGLEALIPRGDEAAGIQQLPIDRIGSNPHQPRGHFDEAELEELAESIRTHGLLQPVVVRSLPGAEYQLIAGERRLRAARMAGLVEVPAVIRDSTAAQQLELALVENLQRSDLNAMEAAGAYQQLAEVFGMTHDEIARRVGKSRVAISNTLRLLDLEPETRDAISGGRISEGHGRALASLTIPEVQRAVLQVVIDRGLSVRQTEELVRRRRPARLARSAAEGPSTALAELESELRALLATRVSIQRARRGGRLVIDFYSDEELDRLYAIIARGVR